MKVEYSDFDRQMMRKALDLAQAGIGQVSPGPLVGCVIVAENGRIVGEGTYRFNEVTHAEVIALNQAGNKSLGGTAYVSLEPHSHFGKTPPCTEALIRAGIKRVVCPIEDPNPLVSGRGFAKLREQGIEVQTGLFKEEAERQNEKFIHWHKIGRPFVHLKLAMSLDGRIATRTGDSKWITNEESRKKSQELRNQNDAILIGAGTALLDNPSLTDRSGKPRNRPLVRVVLDNSLKINTQSNLVETAAEIPTIIFTVPENSQRFKEFENRGVEIVCPENGGRDLKEVLRELNKRNIQSVLVEGGAKIAGAFLDAKLIDKISLFLAPLLIGGSKAPLGFAGTGAKFLTSAMKLKDLKIKKNGDDLEIVAYPVSRF